LGGESPHHKREGGGGREESPPRTFLYFSRARQRKQKEWKGKGKGKEKKRHSSFLHHTSGDPETPSCERGKKEGPHFLIGNRELGHQYPEGEEKKGKKKEPLLSSHHKSEKRNAETGKGKEKEGKKEKETVNSSLSLPGVKRSRKTRAGG